ncbi:four helix bundle protein [Vibrio parahaemolyticus]|nr:four helix bundle protein [Vibrio parahaemolyticus]
MNKTFRHHRIYYDLQKLYKLYWRQHQHLPRAFRFTTGDQILNELTQSIRCSVQANLYGKLSAGKKSAFEWLLELNASLDVVQSLLMLAWELKFLSHGALVLLTEQLESVQRQVAGWRKWFQSQAELGL